jgi:rubrerythrin
MKTIDIFKVAYQMELRGRDFYQQQRDNVKMPMLKEIFWHLVKMEEGHAEYIAGQIAKLEHSESPEPPAQDNTDNLFIERMTRQKITAADLKNDLGDYSIVRMAYLIEKDFAEYYEKSAGLQGDAALKSIFEMLAGWERGHAEMLKNQLEGIIERNSLDLGFYPV